MSILNIITFGKIDKYIINHHDLAPKLSEEEIKENNKELCRALEFIANKDNTIPNIIFNSVMNILFKY